MPIQAQKADGTILEFPAGTSDDVINRTAKTYAAGNTQAGAAPAQNPFAAELARRQAAAASNPFAADLARRQAAAAQPPLDANKLTTEPDGTPGPPLAVDPNRPVTAAPQAAEPPGPTSAATGVINQLLAAFQNTTPITAGREGQNYQPAGTYVNSDAGPMVDPGGGKPWQPLDQAQHVVLLDQQTGQPTVYLRSPQTDTSLPVSLGHVIGFGASAPSDIGA